MTTGYPERLTGDLWLSPSLVAVVPADDAWLGLRELHFAAIGDVTYRFTTDAGSMLPDDAKAAYSSALVAILGQIGATDAGAGSRLLDSICDAAELHDGFDGLEGPALSALLSAGRADRITSSMDRLQFLLSGMGMPDIPGAGYESAAFVGPGGRSLGLVSGDQLGQWRPAETPSSAQSMLDKVDDMLRSGTADVLGQLGVGSGAARDVGNAVGSACEGAALGAAIGSVFGPGGALVGGFVGGLFGFFSSIFGDDDAAATQQRDTGRDVASGDRVAVQADMPLTKNNQPIVMSQTTTTKTVTTTNPDGTQTTTTVTTNTVTTGPAAAQNRPQSPPQNTCPRPTEVKCKLADDAIDPAFEVPYWKDRATLLGAAVPVGPGQDGLVVASANAGWVSLQLAAPAAVDDLGVLIDGGAILDAVLRPASATPQGTTSWLPLMSRLSSGRRRAAVSVHEIVNRLRVEGFAPDDTLDHVLRGLAARSRR